MKYVVLFGLACIALVEGAPQGQVNVPIIAESHIMDQSGQYSLSFEAANGIRSRSRGVLKPTLDGKGNVLHLDGETSYISPEGQLIRLEYTADENGFHPKGDHLPRA